MGKIPTELRQAIARNIRACRIRKFPGRGGATRCAEKLAVPLSQWSQWEKGVYTPNDPRMRQIAEFFDVTVDFLKHDPSFDDTGHNPDDNPTEQTQQPAAVSNCPFFRAPQPGQPYGAHSGNMCWLAERFLGSVRDSGIHLRLHPEDIDLILERLASRQSSTNDG